MNISIDNLFESAKDLDDNVVRQLVKAIEKNNLEGFDYLEFKHSLNQLTSMGVEREIAIKSAFVTASSMGLTESKLFKSAEHYQEVLQGEKQKFGLALQKQVEERIEKRKLQIEKLREKIKLIQDKINELEKNSEEMTELISTAENEIDESKEVISSTQVRFQNAFQAVSTEILQDIESYKQVLKK